MNFPRRMSAPRAPSSAPSSAPIRHDARRALAHGLRRRRSASPTRATTTRSTPRGPLAHPLFAVCYEWPVAVAMRDATIPAALQTRSVHATHHLVIHRPPRAGDTLHTTRPRRSTSAPAAPARSIVTRFETVDAAGAPVTTTDYGSVYRGVDAGADASASRRLARRRGEAPGANAVPSAEPPPCAGAIGWQRGRRRPGERWRACTRSARGSGTRSTPTSPSPAARACAAPILHGTATLALAVSRVVARDARRRCPAACARSARASPAWWPCRRLHRARPAARAAAASPSTRRTRRARPSSARESLIAMQQMSRRERIQAAINRQPVDRVPYAVWRHFPTRGPLAGRPGPGHAALPRSLRLRLPQDHAARRLRRRGLGLRRGRGGPARRPSRVRVVRDQDRPRTGSGSAPLDPMSAEGYGQQIETIIRMGFDRRIGDAPVHAHAVLAAVAGPQARGRPAGRRPARASRPGPRTPWRRSRRR